MVKPEWFCDFKISTWSVVEHACTFFFLEFFKFFLLTLSGSPSVNISCGAKCLCSHTLVHFLRVCTSEFHCQVRHHHTFRFWVTDLSRYTVALCSNIPTHSPLLITNKGCTRDVLARFIFHLVGFEQSECFKVAKKNGL